jgi:CBS domain-containing protein
MDANASQEMLQVQIFVLEGTQWRGEPAYLAILRFLQRQGAAGATVVRGIAGFGAHHRIHQATLVDIGADLPMVVVWIDRADRVARMRPQLEAMSGAGLIVSFPVAVGARPRPLLDHFPHDLRVRHVMTPDVLTVQPDTPLDEVAELFLQSGVRTIPVVDGARRVVGIISDGDLLRRGDVALPLSIREALHPDEVVEALPASDRRARDVMTRQVITVPEDLSIAAAVDVMAGRGFKRLPVLDQQGQLAGIVSRADILQTAAHVTPRAEPRRAPGGRVQRVSDVMQTEVPTVRPDTPLANVVEALAEVEQRRVVVVDAAGRVAGIITDGDVVRRATAEERPGIMRRMFDRLRGGEHEHERYLLVSGRTAADVMTTPVITIAAKATPADAMRLMLEHHIKRLPVLDDYGRLVGLIGRAGVLRALSEAT